MKKIASFVAVAAFVLPTLALAQSFYISNSPTFLAIPILGNSFLYQPSYSSYGQGMPMSQGYDYGYEQYLMQPNYQYPQYQQPMPYNYQQMNYMQPYQQPQYNHYQPYMQNQQNQYQNYQPMYQQQQQQYQQQNSYQQQYSQPSNNYLNYYSQPNQGHVYPYSSSYPTGDRDAFGTPLCVWSDYPTRAPCGQDPQQWIYDPYTGTWY